MAKSAAVERGGFAFSVDQELPAARDGRGGFGQDSAEMRVMGQAGSVQAGNFQALGGGQLLADGFQ